MTNEIKIREQGLAPSPATNGKVIANVRVRILTGMTPENARVGASAAQKAVVATIPSMAAVEGAKAGGHTRGIYLGEFEKEVPIDIEDQNTTQLLSDGSVVHIHRAQAGDEVLLNEAPKPAVVQSKPRQLVSRHNFIMNVFGTSDNPASYGLENILRRQEKGEKKEAPVAEPQLLVPRKELDRAA